MNKKILVFLLLMSIVIKSYSQSEYSDAMNILYQCIDKNTGYFKKNGPTTILLSSYLRNYIPERFKADTTLTDMQIIEIFKSNPFFGDKIDSLMNGTNSSGLAGFISPTFSKSIGGLDITNIADGLAKFLVERTKQELNVAFFNNFYDLIKSDEYKDARILFPQTYTNLMVIGGQIYNYEAYINALREAFEKDLNGLLSNLPKILKDERYDKIFNKHPELKAICLNAIYIGNGLLTKKHPGKIIADFDTELFGNSNINVEAGIQTLQLFSESLRSSESNPYWDIKDSLEKLTSNKIAFEIYLGLVYTKTDAIKFNISGNEITFKKILETIAKHEDQILMVKSYVNGIIQQTDLIGKAIKNISGKDREKLNFTDYYDFYNTSLDLIEYVGKVKELPLPGVFDTTSLKQLQNFVVYSREAGYLAMDLNRKNYSSAIIHSYSLYNAVFSVSDDELIKLITEGLPTQAAIDSAKKLLSDRKFSKQFILKYGSFLAAVAQAQNSDDVKKAIEAVALPSGSARIKRESCFNVSLNAYLGLYAGKEKIDGIDLPAAFSYGVTAPIGVAISRGHSFLFAGTGEKGWEKGKCGWSTSLLLSVVDIGALASFRSSNDSVSQVPTIKLEDIISPGIFLSFGIPKSPISINFGGQIGPNLRTVGADGNTYSENLYWKFTGAICVDLPLLNFYTKPKD